MLSKLQQIAADKREARENGDAGFTLIELLVVVVIIGILIAIAIPLYLNYQKGSHDKSAQSDLRGAVSAIQQCYSENNNAYPAGTATNTATAATFSCNGITETANLSDGTTFTYTAYSDAAKTTPCVAPATCVAVVMTTKNSSGNNKTYTYDSTVGGKIS